MNSVSVIGRVLKETVVRIEDLTREKKEKFSARTTVVKTIMELGGGGGGGGRGGREREKDNEKNCITDTYIKHMQMTHAELHVGNTKKT